MFKKAKDNTVLTNLEQYLNIMDQSVLVFQEGVRNYLHRDMQAVESNLQSIVKLGNDSTLLVREIEADLYRQPVAFSIRGDILRLIERMGHIIDALNNNLFQFKIESPNIPQELNADFLKLLELSCLSVSDTIPAAKAFFREPGVTSDKVRRVYFYQKETDRQAKFLKNKVFHDMEGLKLSEKVHLRYFALHIEELAIQAMKVADQLSVMSLRSQTYNRPFNETDRLSLVAGSASLVISVAALCLTLSGRSGDVSPNFVLAFIASVTALLFVLCYIILRSRWSKRISDRKLIAQENEISSNNRKLSEMEVQIMQMEKDHLQNLLDLKRKETTNVVEKITEQRDFIDSIYGMVQNAESARDAGERDAILHDIKVQLDLRRNNTGSNDEFYAQVEQLHQDFSARLAAKFPQLTAQERKLAMLLRLEFTTKYIATVLNISPKSVEIERHRMRAKMGLTRDRNLIEFIKTI